MRKFNKYIFAGDDNYKILCKKLHKRLDEALELHRSLQAMCPIDPWDDKPEPDVILFEKELDNCILDIRTALGDGD